MPPSITLEMANMATLPITVYAGARMLAGEPFKHEAAIAKLYSSEIAVTNAREATQIFGGCGFMNEIGRASCRERVSSPV